MTAAPTALQSPQRDIDAVRDAALDYIDGYTTGDAPRQAAPITPGIKRRFLTTQTPVSNDSRCCPHA
ncbi:MAG: hypothetical protein M3O70_07090 [Actinomycetota bacterium]|nr:hypothetical protein [Actinomycetota bacterium]